MKLRLLSALLTCAATVSYAQAPAASQPNQRAEKAKVERVVDAWLATMDGGKHGDTWKALSRSTTAKVEQGKWVTRFEEHDKQFGKRQGRRFQAIRLHRDATAGGQPFYLVEFDVVTAQRGALRELVRVVKDDDGQWRVAGYSLEERHPGGGEEED